MSGYRSKYLAMCQSSRECLRDKFDVKVDLKNPTNVSFIEFVEALSRDQPKHLNVHFRPISYLCDLYSIPYDYYAEMERFDHMEYISDKIGVPHGFHNLTRPLEHKKEEERFQCTSDTVEIAQIIYAPDAKMLGYSFADALKACGEYGLTSAPNDD